MSSALSDINEVTKQAKISIASAEVEKEFSSALNNLSRTVNIKGFRPGKAPKAVVEKMHGMRVRLEVANRMITDRLRKIVQEEDLKMVGNPEIELSTFEPGKDLEFTANISLLPSPKISSYDKFEIEIEKSEIKDQDVDDVLKNLRSSRAKITKIEGREEIKAEDVISGEIQVAIDGQEFSPKEPIVLGLGEKRLPEEVEQALIGSKLGIEQEITVILGDQAREDLRGKTAIYRISVTEVSAKELPEVNEEFIKSLNFPGVETEEQLKEDIKKRLIDENQQIEDSQTSEKILNILSEQNEFMIPQLMVDTELRYFLSERGIIDPQLAEQGEIDLDPFREKYEADSKARLKRAIILDRISEQESIKVTEEEFHQHIHEIADRYGVSHEAAHKFFDESNRRVRTEVELARNKVIKFLKDRAEIKTIAKA